MIWPFNKKSDPFADIRNYGWVPQEDMGNHYWIHPFDRQQRGHSAAEARVRIHEALRLHFLTSGESKAKRSAASDDRPHVNCRSVMGPKVADMEEGVKRAGEALNKSHSLYDPACKLRVAPGVSLAALAISEAAAEAAERLHKGGIVEGDRMSLRGENGPEAIIPLASYANAELAPPSGVLHWKFPEKNPAPTFPPDFDPPSNKF